MSFFRDFFESGAFRTIKRYTAFLTFLNVPYLIAGLVGKGKIIFSAICAGSSLMFSSQVELFRFLVDWIGVLSGKKAVFAIGEKWLIGISSVRIASGIILVLGILLSVVIIHWVMKLLSRMIPSLAKWQEHHRYDPTGFLYLALLIFYIYVTIAG